MIAMKEIKKAINTRLMDKFIGIEINSNDVREGFKRPSFFVGLEGKSSGGQGHVEKEIDVQLYYFPTDPYDYSIELLNVQETLQTLFDLKLRVADRYINITDTNAVVTDGVLSLSFSLEFTDVRDVLQDSDWIIQQFPDAEGKGPSEEHFEKYPVELMEELEMILKE